MKMSKFIKFVPILFIMFMLTGCGVKTIEPGYVGIKINRMGNGRGVENSPTLSGWVTYNPFSEVIVEYPISVQTAIWSANPGEGHATNEELTFTTRDGTVVFVDMSVSWQLDPTGVPQFYATYRLDNINLFTHGMLRNITRDAFNEIGSKYTTEQLLTPDKNKMLEEIRAYVNVQIEPIHAKIVQFGIIGSPRLPKTIQEAIVDKNTANQKAAQATNEVAVNVAEAQKKVAEAEGIAKSNAIVNASITDKILEMKRLDLQQQFIAKWDGHLPTYIAGNAGNPMTMLPIK